MHPHPPAVLQARDKQLDSRRKANREAEAVSGVAEGAVPKGNTPWERVISVCNFNAEGLSKDPFKELSRWEGLAWVAGWVGSCLACLLACTRVCPVSAAGQGECSLQSAIDTRLTCTLARAECSLSCT
jgi:hypothetical protein